MTLECLPLKPELKKILERGIKSASEVRRLSTTIDFWSWLLYCIERFIRRACESYSISCLPLLSLLLGSGSSSEPVFLMLGYPTLLEVASR